MMVAFFENGGLLPYLDLWFSASETLAYILYLLTVALSIVVPFFIGTINPSELLSKKEICQLGYKEATLTNLYHCSTTSNFVFGCLIDVFKMGLSILFAAILSGSGRVSGYELYFQVYLAVLFCVIGDIFPRKNRGRGGMGLICALSGIAYLSFFPFLISLLTFVVMLLISKYLSLSIGFSFVIYPLFYTKLFEAFFNGSAPGQDILCMFGIAISVFYRSFEGMKRVYHHEEDAFSFRPKFREVPHD